MKNKILVMFVMLIVSVLLFSACREETSKSETNVTNKEQLSTSTGYISIEQITDTVSKNNEYNGDIGGAVLTVPKYRSCFYSVPAPFVELVGNDVWYEWMLTIDHTQNTETMVMKQFVQEFGISREQFDKANLEFAKIIRDKMSGSPCLYPKDYANQISEEIFNADIVFTFDDELIRDYYLSPDYQYVYIVEYEEAVANGEYTSQTEEWVDVEALEAEIIAKYGEAEIVTEETSTIPTEQIELTAEQPEPIE